MVLKALKLPVELMIGGEIVTVRVVAALLAVPSLTTKLMVRAPVLGTAVELL